MSVTGIGPVDRNVQSARPGAARAGHRIYSALLLLAVVASALSNTSCGATGTKADPPAQTPIIAVTLTKPPPVSMIVANAVPVSGTVTNDPANAGVDWVATCGSAPLCGSFSPAHTASGQSTVYTAPSQVPTQGGTVAVTALSSTNHGEQSVAYVNILSGVSSITISEPPPANLPAGVAITVAATVLGDPANLGVDWSATCGTAGVQHTPVNCTSIAFPSGAHQNAGGTIMFIVPSTLQIANIVGATVTLTAYATADHAFSATASSVVAAGPTIAFTQVPPNTMFTNVTAPVAAVVSNDSTNSGVFWSVGCQEFTCGTITPARTPSGQAAIFTPPASIPGPSLAVTITAAVAASPSITVMTNVTLVEPLAVQITQGVLTSSLNRGGTASLIATVTNDPQNAGVDWTVSCGSTGACGSFSPTHTASGATTTFTAPGVVPAGNTVTIKATSAANPGESDQQTVTITTRVPPNQLLLGNFVFLLTAKSSANGPYALGGIMSGDGLGDITGGNLDLVDASGNASPSTVIPLLPSTYSIGSDGRGQINLKINTGALNGGFGVNASGALTLSVVFINPQHALLAETDSFGTGTGTLDLQNPADLQSFVNGSWQNGIYSLKLSGVGGSSPHPDYSLASALTMNFPAYSSVADQSAKGVITSVPFSGGSHNFLSTRNPNGELVLSSVNLGLPTQFNLDVWLIDANHFVVTDWRDSFLASPPIIVSGYLTVQVAASLSGSYAFSELGATSAGQSQVAGGILTCGSTGILDVTPLGGSAVSNAPVNATCSAPTNGRGVITISGANTGGISQFAAYPTVDQGLYILELDGGATGTSGPWGAGVAFQQNNLGPISNSTLNGKYASNFLAQTSGGFESFAGQAVPDGVSALAGTVDVNSFSAGSSGSTATPSLGAALTGSFTTASNGRSQLALNLSPAAGQPALPVSLVNPACYVVDTNTCLLLGLDASAPGTGVLKLQNTPTVLSLSPNLGGGATQTFTVVVSDPSGPGDLNNLQLLFNTTPNRLSSCNISYDPTSNRINLYDDGSTGFIGAVIPGTSGQVSNSQCTLSGAGSSYSTSANVLSLTVALSFSATLTAQQNAYVYVQGTNGLNNGGWAQWGSWVP